MNSLHFADVNVWVALHHELHVHHDAAMTWFESLDGLSMLVFCRQTQMGFFRLMTSEAVMGDEVLSQRQCWALYKQWIEGGKALFHPEPAGMDEVFQAGTMSDSASPKLWMDAYLAAFAEAGHLRLVTFDRALAAKSPNSILLD